MSFVSLDKFRNTEKFIFIRKIETTGTEDIFQIFNLKLKRKTLLKVVKVDENLKSSEDVKDVKNIEKCREITTIQKLTALKIPNIITYINDGKHKINNNKITYVEVDSQDGTLKSFIDNKNVLSFKDVISIFIELLYTLMLFRKYNFKHTNISTSTIMYKINIKPRTYIFPGNNKEHSETFSKNETSPGDEIRITVNNIVHLSFSNFKDSIFEKYNIDDELSYKTDVYYLQEVLFELLNSISLNEEQTTYIQSIFNMFEQDDLQSSFLCSVLKKIISDYIF